MLQLFEDYLKNYLVAPNCPVPKLREAISYSLLNGGKRVRPQFIFLTAKMLEVEDLQQFFPLAAAIEMIHTYSLIHDDLPAMDNDDFRRGKPANHKIFGEALAILAGDALFSLANQLLSNYPVDILPQLLLTINEASSNMVSGQVLDIEAQARTLEDLVKMHSLKTGALIKAAILAPAIILQLDNKRKNALASYAENIGLAFQIKDDLLDLEGTITDLGKTPQKDLNKKTFVTLLGKQKAREMLESTTQKAIDSLLIFGDRSNLLIEFSKFLLGRKK